MPDPIIFNFDNPSEEEIQRFIDFSNNMLSIFITTNYILLL